jgi:phosphoenolpyruvate synthase/pyruvate phosphate dikinase
MSVIIQEQVDTEIGGVMITKNPLVKTDFRNVYINVSAKSVVNIVQGSELPMQYLFNTVEGGGNTISLGDAKEELPMSRINQLQLLAVIGKLMQGHFSPDYTFSQPMDMEWLMHGNTTYLLQVRPFAK